MTVADLTILGETVRQPIAADKLEGIPCPPNVIDVTMTSEEGTSMCPVTGQPDFWTVAIHYEPIEWCLESKSLKLFLWGYRDRKVFAEALAQDICEAVFASIHPAWIEVDLWQRPRGGITLTAKARLDQ